MQFGLFTLFDFFPDRQNEVTYYKDTLALMVYAERLGFDSVWVGEEHFYSFGITLANADVLRHALLDAAANSDQSEPRGDSGFGEVYVLRFPLRTTKGIATVLSA